MLRIAGCLAVQLDIKPAAGSLPGLITHTFIIHIFGRVFNTPHTLLITRALAPRTHMVADAFIYFAVWTGPVLQADAFAVY
jgi:hypothetical protein